MRHFLRARLTIILKRSRNAVRRFRTDGRTTRTIDKSVHALRVVLASMRQALANDGMRATPAPAAETEETRSIVSVLKSMRGALFGIAGFSGVINLLALSGSIFMLQVYDRVLPSQSVPTLVALTVIIGGLFLFQAGLDVIRSRLLVRIASEIDEALGAQIGRAHV